MEQANIDTQLKGFILKIDFEEKIIGRHIDNLAMHYSRLHDANLIATAMAFFQRFYLH